jgi:hypothetical protein
MSEKTRDWCVALFMTVGFAAGAPSFGDAAMVVGMFTPMIAFIIRSGRMMLR